MASSDSRRGAAKLGRDPGTYTPGRAGRVKFRDAAAPTRVKRDTNLGDKAPWLRSTGVDKNAVHHKR